MKESVYRALRTFGQAMLGYLAANLLEALTQAEQGDESAFAGTLFCVFGAAVAAGIAAVMNWKKEDGTYAG